MKYSKFLLAAVASLPALSLPVAGLAIATGLTMTESKAEASPLPNSRLASSSNPSGVRGAMTSWRVRLTANGRPVANTPIAFTSRSDGYATRSEGVAMTDANGYATLHFRIPTSVRADNVILTAISGGGPFTAITDKRVAIGR